MFSEVSVLSAVLALYLLAIRLARTFAVWHSTEALLIIDK